MEVATTPWKELSPQSPFYLFVPRDMNLQAEYDQGWKVTDIFPVNSVGIVTARDHLTIHWSPDEMWDTVRDFVRPAKEAARERYALGKDVRDWKVHLAQEDVQASRPDRRNVVPILYRPFDVRHTYYTGQTRGFLCMPRPDVMRHMLAGKNRAFHLCRQIISDGWQHILATNHITDDSYVSNKTRERGYTLPLYLFSE
jgi:hypothetical protein